MTTPGDLKRMYKQLREVHWTYHSHSYYWFSHIGRNVWYLTFSRAIGCQYPGRRALFTVALSRSTVPWLWYKSIDP